MNIECPHNSTPQVGDKIPSHFSTIEAYQKWRADIEPTIEKMKHDIYPYRNAGYHDYGYYDLGVPSPPRPGFGFSPFSFMTWYTGQIKYHMSRWWPPMPILLEQDRHFLEYKLYRIKTYIDRVHPFIKDCMMDDMNLILAGLAWREKVYEILRENFPGVPLEYTENPLNPRSRVFVGLLCLFVLPFPNFLIGLENSTGLNLSDAFNLMPLTAVPSFAELAAVGPEMNEFVLQLSYGFYLIFVGAIETYIHPSLDIRYSLPKSHRVLLFELILTLCIITPNYLYPPILIMLLVKIPSVFTVFLIISLGILAWGVAGILLGTLGFKLKQRLENNRSSE